MKKWEYARVFVFPGVREIVSGRVWITSVDTEYEC